MCSALITRATGGGPFHLLGMCHSKWGAHLQSQPWLCLWEVFRMAVCLAPFFVLRSFGKKTAKRGKPRYIARLGNKHTALLWQCNPSHCTSNPAYLALLLRSLKLHPKKQGVTHSTVNRESVFWVLVVSSVLSVMLSNNMQLTDHMQPWDRTSEVCRELVSLWHPLAPCRGQCARY